jgi:predicted nucleic acid-binding protein
MIVVSDNSPLQYLIIIGCVDVLPKLYREILATPEVVHELRHPQTP